MVFYLNYLSTSEKMDNFNIFMKKKPSKLDRAFIKYLLNCYSDKKEIFIEILNSKIKSILALDKSEDIQTYLDRLMQAKLYYSFTNKDGYLCKGAFHILDSYFIQKDSIIMVLSKEILMSFDTNTLFNRVNLKTILDFESNNTLPIYLKILNYEISNDEKSINFYLEELKELLEVCNCYDRFYDFEKKVLEPIIEDLNTYSEYQVSFEKIKKSETPSSKILGVTLSFHNKKIEELKGQVNKLLHLLKGKVENFDLIYNYIFENLQRYGYDYVYDNITYVTKKDFSKKEHKNFDNFLIKALNENLGYLMLKEEENNRVIVEKFLKSPYELHDEISKAIVKLGTEKIVEDHIFVASFIHNVYQLKDGESYVFKGSGVKVEVVYNKKTKSRIEISVI